MLYDDIVNNQDCLKLALKEARESLITGNYPVGAVLKIGDSIYFGNNQGETSKNYSNHAETSLIIQKYLSIFA